MLRRISRILRVASVPASSDMSGHGRADPKVAFLQGRQELTAKKGKQSPTEEEKAEAEGRPPESVG